MGQEIDGFLIGARVQLSKLGAARCPRTAAKTGTIVGWGRFTGSINVRFDGNRTATPLHRDYVEPVGLSRSRPPKARTIRTPPPTRQTPKDDRSQSPPSIDVGLSERSEPRFLLSRSELLERRRRRRKHPRPSGQFTFATWSSRRSRRPKRWSPRASPAFKSDLQIVAQRYYVLCGVIALGRAWFLTPGQGTLTSTTNYRSQIPSRHPPTSLRCDKRNLGRLRIPAAGLHNSRSQRHLNRSIHERIMQECWSDYHLRSKC